MTMSEYLHNLLIDYTKTTFDDQLFNQKIQEVKESLEKYFGDKILKGFLSGSYAKSSEINDFHDLDWVVVFKKDAIEKDFKGMFEQTCECFKKKFENDKTVEVRRQKVSIGLNFQLSNREIDIDVVPAREKDDYAKNKEVWLYVNPERNGGKNEAPKLSNIEKSIDSLKGRNAERQVLRLLKIWKYQHCQILKSYFLELMTLEAFEKIEADGNNLWVMLKTTLEYISKEIENYPHSKEFDIKMPQRIEVKVKIKKMLEAIEEDADNIKKFFY